LRRDVQAFATDHRSVLLPEKETKLSRRPAW
jgi:hypothetical protein